MYKDTVTDYMTNSMAKEMKTLFTLKKTVQNALSTIMVCVKLVNFSTD